MNDFIIDLPSSILNNRNIRNKNLLTIFHNYKFLNITKENQIIDNIQIFKDINSSNLFIINYFEKFSSKYFVIGFKNALIVIEISLLHLLRPYLQSNNNLFSYFICDKEDTFQDIIKLNFKEIKLHNNFQIELNFLNEKISIKSALIEKWNTIKPCILGYLVLQSYDKLNQNRLEKFSPNLNNDFHNEIIKDDDFIEMENVGQSNNSLVKLIYNLKKEEFMVIKKFIINNETDKLINREIENYPKISHPFIPKFYGKTKNNDLIIEFINGSLLNQIKKLDLKYNEKLTIIFELMIVIEYLHHNNFVYRDLKPDNIIIDQNKMVVLIDFDRMIDINAISKRENITFDFFSHFAAPEFNDKNVSFESDIYSLGKLIYYIMNETVPYENSPSICDLKIDKMWNICTNKNPKKRPSLKGLIIEFFIYFHENILIENLFKKFENHFLEIYDPKTVDILKNMSNNKNNPKTINFFGDLFYNGQYVSKDINKGIQY